MLHYLIISCFIYWWIIGLPLIYVVKVNYTTIYKHFES